MALHDDGGRKGAPGLVDKRQGCGQPLLADPDRNKREVVGVIEIKGAFDGPPGALHHNIVKHTDHRHGCVGKDKALADHALRRKPETLGAGSIDQGIKRRLLPVPVRRHGISKEAARSEDAHDKVP